MKKFILLFSFLTYFILGFSQISVTDINGNPINDGDIFTFNNEATLVTLVTNNSASQIELRLVAESITGAKGDGMEFCIGACYVGITAGTIYPTGTTHFYLDAGATTSETDIHFLHHILDGDPDVTEYNFKIYDDGNENGNYLRFTYKFDKNYVGIKDIQKNEISVYPNPADDKLFVSVSEKYKVKNITISNLLGKTVTEVPAISGKTEIPVKNLKNGIYFVSLKTKNGIIETKKLLIKH